MLLKLALPTLLLAFAVGVTEWDRYHGIQRPLSFEELEAHLRSEFDLHELQLAHLPDGRFEGNGTGTNGRSYQFEISQTSESRTIQSKWKRGNERESGGGSKSIVFSDHTHLYLVLVFGYLVWVGKVIRNHGRRPGSTAPRLGAHTGAMK